MNSSRENFLLYSGEHYLVYFHAETNGSSEVHDYYKDCDDVTRASLLYFVNRIADVVIFMMKPSFVLRTNRIKFIVLSQRKSDSFASSLQGEK